MFDCTTNDLICCILFAVILFLSQECQQNLPKGAEHAAVPGKGWLDFVAVLLVLIIVRKTRKLGKYIRILGFNDIYHARRILWDILYYVFNCFLDVFSALRCQCHSGRPRYLSVAQNNRRIQVIMTLSKDLARSSSVESIFQPQFWGKHGSSPNTRLSIVLNSFEIYWYRRVMSLGQKGEYK